MNKLLIQRVAERWGNEVKQEKLTKEIKNFHKPLSEGGENHFPKKVGIFLENGHDGVLSNWPLNNFTKKLRHSHKTIGIWFSLRFLNFSDKFFCKTSTSEHEMFFGL